MQVIILRLLLFKGLVQQVSQLTTEHFRIFRDKCQDRMQFILAGLELMVLIFAKKKKKMLLLYYCLHD